MVRFVNGEVKEVRNGNGVGKNVTWDMEGMRNWIQEIIEQAIAQKANKIVFVEEDINEWFNRFYKGNEVPKTFSTITGKKGEMVWRLKHKILKNDNRIKNIRATKIWEDNKQVHAVIIELNGIAVNVPTTKTETPETPKKSLEEVMTENQKKIEQEQQQESEELDDIEIEIPSN